MTEFKELPEDDSVPEKEDEEFAIIFQGEKARLINKYAKLWKRGRKETVGLACALLQMHSDAKMQNKKVMLMDQDGVFTIVGIGE